ncbi:MAG TPA: tetratricopeptide repeat protein [Kofleriaceae bacterium]|jgi:hypothetical protein|nr:tetratricopeptide repeat protein [Kofleriaceae bacterium]
MRASLIAVAIGVLTPAAVVAAPPPPQGPPSRSREPAPPNAPAHPAATPNELLQKEADRHFESGVALFREAKYAEALDEFERAYEISPHPLVLFNIAECHRALLHYAEAVVAYRQFLVDGNGRISAARLATAQTELDALLTLVARVTVTIAPTSEEAALILDGRELDRPVMPLILPPGEHRLIARAAGRRDAARTLQLSAGDSLSVQLELGELPRIAVERVVTVPAPGPSLALDAGFGMNLRRLGKTGAPSVGLGAAIGSRLGVGVDFVLVAYAVVPSIRVRVIGDALSLHVIGAFPIALSSDPMSGSFVTLAGGLAVRYRATPRLAVRLESYVSFGGKDQDTALPTFLGGELWF